MKKNSQYMIFMIIFYVLVAFFAFAFLSRDLSVFNRKYVDEVIEAQQSESVVGNIAATTQDEAVKVEIEEVTKAIEATSEASAETSEEIVVEETVSTEEVSSEEVVETETDEEIAYYSYTTNNTSAILRVREEPSINSTVLQKLNPGSKGYVLEKGEEWCKVVTADNVVGYCSTEFLDLEEIDKEDFPEEYVELVTSTR